MSRNQKSCTYNAEIIISELINREDNRNAKQTVIFLSNVLLVLSPPQRLLFFNKPRKRGKGGKKGKAEKREII